MQHLRESQERYNNLFKHCRVLEKQIEDLQAAISKGPQNTDAAPGAHQENTGESHLKELQELQQRFSESQQQLCNSKQEQDELRKLLEAEQHRRVAAESQRVAAENQRVAAENALSMVEEQIRR
ncbi:golgin subfamily B member 1-like [Otolemur garnettii]|uniref:golgin subfamily B member 1-like n=1 Tax=Otolemur garnettii TaxID=30611 RepID=UPI000C7F6A9C|nr:golgin subfamily B member 1-like [Otolemur garnettii]